MLGIIGSVLVNVPEAATPEPNHITLNAGRAKNIFKKNFRNFDLCNVFFHSPKALQLVIALSKDKKPTIVLVKASSRLSKRELTVIGDSGQLVLVLIINLLKFGIDNVHQRYFHLKLKENNFLVKIFSDM